MKLLHLSLGRKIMVSLWRHKIKTIVRGHFIDGDKFWHIGDSANDEGEMADSDNAIWSLQLDHSERTGALAYGR